MSGAGLRTVQAATQLVNQLGGRLVDDHAGREIQRVVPAARSSMSTDLVLLGSARYLAELAGGAGLVLCSPELEARVGGRSRWMHPHPLWVVSQLLEEVQEPPRIHPSSVVEAGAQLGAEVAIGAGVVVRSGARVGEGCRIEPNVVLYDRVVLGRKVRVGASTVMGRPGFGFATSPQGELVRVPQLGGVVVEDDVEIGPLCTIDAGTLEPTRIGRGAKLDAQVHVGHNVIIGRGVLVAAQSGFAGSARVGDGVLVGGQSGISDHVVVGPGARIAAKTGVVRDVPAGETVAGFPAVSRIRWLRAMAQLLNPRRGS